MSMSSEPRRSHISHAPVVAMGHFSDGLAAIWTGLVLNMSGFYPLIVFLKSVNDPHYMTTMLSWLIVSLPLFLGVLFGAFGVKERGYQRTSFRLFGIISLGFGVLCFLIPVAASLLYANGIGN